MVASPTMIFFGLIVIEAVETPGHQEADGHPTMLTICAGELPQGVLLDRYAKDGAYTDCYHVDFPRAISMSEYVAAFYTTPLFKIERRILALLAGKPSTDTDAEELARGQTARFAAWDVEARANDQLLLRDFLGRTRSWLMVGPAENAGASATRLYFGSAFVRKSISATGAASFDFTFHALSGFHRLYSKALLRAAFSKLAKAT